MNSISTRPFDPLPGFERDLSEVAGDVWVCPPPAFELAEVWRADRNPGDDMTSRYWTELHAAAGALDRSLGDPADGKPLWTPGDGGPDPGR